MCVCTAFSSTPSLSLSPPHSPTTSLSSSWCCPVHTALTVCVCLQDWCYFLLSMRCVLLSYLLQSSIFEYYMLTRRVAVHLEDCTFVMLCCFANKNSLLDLPVCSSSELDKISSIPSSSSLPWKNTSRISQSSGLSSWKWRMTAEAGMRLVAILSSCHSCNTCKQCALASL